MRKLVRKSLVVAAITVGALAVKGCSRELDAVAPVDPYAQLPLDTFDCPLPFGLLTTGTGPRIPSVGHVYPRLSPDGRKLAYIVNGRADLRILDIPSVSLRVVDVQSLLPIDVDIWECSVALWCPYDSDRLLIHAVTWTDTTGDGRGEIYGQNAYIIDLTTNECSRVTPLAYGPYGSFNGFMIQAWLPGSRPGSDSLLGEFSKLTTPEAQAVYVPQTDEMIERPDRELHSVSPDGTRWLTTRWNDDLISRSYWINGVPLRLPIAAYGAAWYSWSPDSKRLAMSVMPHKPHDTVYVFEQIWVVDVDALLVHSPELAPATVIDAQERFCTYAMRGHWPTFITNNTLAISMHRDGDRIQPLWEITLDGRRIRQLTR